MPTFLGAAYLDGSGAIVAADGGIAAPLGASDGDPRAVLARRAEADPEVAAVLRGDGRAARLDAGAPGGRAVELRRVDATPGAFVIALATGPERPVEHPWSDGLARLAGGVAHDIKNPLNAMALQIALLAEKLSAPGDATAAAASHLAVLRDQIGRVNEVLRRFVDVADPSAPLGYTDVGALVSDTASLFAHEARRRRVQLEVDAPPGAVRTACDPARVGRLVLGLLARAVAETPDGGRVAARAAGRGRVVEVTIDRLAGDAADPADHETDAAVPLAAALGGSFQTTREGGAERGTLTLPRYEG